MSDLKPCPCCNASDAVCSFTVSLENGIVMFGCARCAFLAENITTWNNRPHESKIKADAVLDYERSLSSFPYTADEYIKNFIGHEELERGEL